MKLISTLIFMLFISVANAKSMHDLANEYMNQFVVGMDLDEVRAIIMKQNSNGQFYNKCTEKHQYPMEPCSKGYTLIEIIKLPTINRTATTYNHLKKYTSLLFDRIEGFSFCPGSKEHNQDSHHSKNKNKPSVR